MSTDSNGGGTGRRLATSSAIVLAFVVALEFVIMISPFAFVFYAAMNPFLLALNQSALTRWLTAFFLPHMVVPPNAFLKGIRVLGSVAFLGGMAVFVVCALQVYAGKLLRPGVARRGLYAVIRHPQYLALAVAAWGLAVMWPRFLTLTLFGVMLFLYYLLARDEERRMLNRFGESYRAYMERTGMFVPRVVERFLGRRDGARPGLTVPRAVRHSAWAAGGVRGQRLPRCEPTPCGICRWRRFPGVDAITITADDLEAAKELLPSVLAEPAVASKLQAVQGRAGEPCPGLLHPN